eukprot:GILK01010937.1.p2 GENE.GILK01010937.1~~GILK01010937.1.p2  ORF type:complete len:100 (-),score=20.14 GILK01010937.1:234-533(-)
MSVSTEYDDWKQLDEQEDRIEARLAEIGPSIIALPYVQYVGMGRRKDEQGNLYFNASGSVEIVIEVHVESVEDAASFREWEKTHPVGEPLQVHVISKDA